jgi:hypothetical protein
VPLTLGLDDIENARELLVSMAVFDGNAESLNDFEGANLLSISPGVVSSEELAGLALAAADAGSALSMVVVVNPDVTDVTSGQIAVGKLSRLPSGASVDGQGDEALVLFGTPHLGTDQSHVRLFSEEH